MEKYNQISTNFNKIRNFLEKNFYNIFLDINLIKWIVLLVQSTIRLLSSEQNMTNPMPLDQKQKEEIAFFLNTPF